MRYDLKTRPEWRGGVYSYNGETITAEDLGNQLFGYYIGSMELPDIYARWGGGWFDAKKDFDKWSRGCIEQGALILYTGGDQLRDTGMIMKGWSLYRATHPPTMPTPSQ
jgi:hypothetical protein